MRGNHHGRAQPVERFEQAQQLDRHVRIDVAGRFVRHQQFRTANDCPGNGNALLFPTRKLRRAGMHPLGQADPFEHVSHRLCQVAFGNACDPQRQGDIVIGGQVLNQPEVLEHHPQAAAEARQAIARQGDRIGPEHPDHPARWALGQVQQPKQRRLPRAAGTGQEIKAARKQGERYVAQHFAIGTIAQSDIVEMHDLSRSTAGHRKVPGFIAGKVYPARGCFVGGYSDQSMWKKGQCVPPWLRLRLPRCGTPCLTVGS